MAFDLVTDDVGSAMASACEPQAHLLTLGDYLGDTGREGPDLALHVDEPPEPSPSKPSEPEPGVHVAVHGPITSKLLRSIDVSVRQAANRLAMHLEEALCTSPDTPLVFWEVYSGSGGLSKEMSRLGFDVKTFDLPEWDFTKISDRKRFMDLLHKERPHAVWLAPPCPKWSPLQSLTSRDECQQELLDIERQQQHSSHLKLSRRVFDFQYESGMVSVIEHPKPSLAWKTPAFRSLRSWATILHQCAFGARLPDQHGRLMPIKKATRLQVTHEVLHERLSVRCPGHAFHLPLVGHSPRIGSRSAPAAAYQPEMCRALALALQAGNPCLLPHLLTLCTSKVKELLPLRGFGALLCTLHLPIQS